MSKFNGMIHDDSSIQSKCNVCREELGKIIKNPYLRVCEECADRVNTSLVKFLGDAKTMAEIEKHLRKLNKQKKEVPIQ